MDPPTRKLVCDLITALLPLLILMGMISFGANVWFAAVLSFVLFVGLAIWLPEKFC